MNWNQVEANWDQVRGKIRTAWGKLTDDDLEASRGRREQLIGKIRERYGIGREEAERKVDDFVHRL
jgi:uncharacterized protein YjbJ (UPF0337 family)